MSIAEANYAGYYDNLTVGKSAKSGIVINVDDVEKDYMDSVYADHAKNHPIYLDNCQMCQCMKARGV